MSGRKPIIDLRGVRTQFILEEGTVTALDGIDLTIFENESLGIVGETGCGKSMTAFSILRLVPSPGKITAGRIFFMEPTEVRLRRLQLEEEARAWYRGRSPEEKKKLFLKYEYRDLGRGKKERRRTTEKIEKLVPPAEAPESVVSGYLAEKAKTIPESDSVGRKAALCKYDLLNKSMDEMRGIRGKSISMIFQDASTALDPVFTVGFQLGEVISLHQNVYDHTILTNKTINVLKLVKIAAPLSVLKQYPHELSGGMKQRVMIALALSCNPTLLIADEPTTALDVTIQAQILKLLKEVVKVAGSSMMLITHNLGVVAETCDRVCIMYAGRIVEIAETFDLFGDPQHPYTKGLLTAFPKLGEHKEELAVIRGTVPNLMKPFPGCSFVDRCDFAVDTCRRVRPIMTEVKPGHFVSCHLYSQGGAKGDGA
ncbi:MAG TPA: ABC transporter ATP-binding protein [Thermoplasmata archaeon]|jgi:oligopeptide/dipeptide ABC transporter ATP-binding protein